MSLSSPSHRRAHYSAPPAWPCSVKAAGGLLIDQATDHQMLRRGVRDPSDAIEYEDAKGAWHTETARGTDRPETDVEDSR
jgi:hypothetical protein